MILRDTVAAELFEIEECRYRDDFVDIGIDVSSVFDECQVRRGLSDAKTN